MRYLTAVWRRLLPGTQLCVVAAACFVLMLAVLVLAPRETPVAGTTPTPKPTRTPKELGIGHNVLHDGHLFILVREVSLVHHPDCPKCKTLGPLEAETP